MDKHGRISRRLLVILTVLVISAAAGFAVQGWKSFFLWPMALCAIVAVIFIASFILELIIAIGRSRGLLAKVRERLRSLSNEQLIEIMRTPAHQDSQFALAELMRRGVDARPSKDQLFGMLCSGNPVLCGHAMANLQMFYPDIVLPEGSSNLDPPVLWQSRIEAFRRPG